MAKSGGFPACERCGSAKVIKKGWRRKKLERVQAFQCKSCGHKFNPWGLKDRTYPARIILEALSLYNLGHSLARAGELVGRKCVARVPPQTVHLWTRQFKDFCPYHRLRAQAKEILPPAKVLQTVLLRHQQVYRFRVHTPKLDLLSNDHLRGLREFLAEAVGKCPHKIFLDPARPSQLQAGLKLDGVYIARKENAAVRMAGLALKASPSNKLRHETLQKFMLCNDSVTVAVEVPVWLLPEELEGLKAAPGFRIPFKLEKPLAGHIDFVQVRGGAVHVLDYKPEAAKERHAHEQLVLYALALSARTGIKLKDMRCAWFDEKDYFEFFPLLMVYSRPGAKIQAPPPRTKMSYFERLPKGQVVRELRHYRAPVRGQFLKWLYFNFPPRVIEDTKNHKRYRKAAEILLAALEFEKMLHEDSAEAREFLRVILPLIESYEQKKYPSAADPEEVLKFLMEQHSLKQEDLAKELGGQPVVSEVLSGKRRLNIDQMKRLARRFNISPASFFPR